MLHATRCGQGSKLNCCILLELLLSWCWCSLFPSADVHCSCRGYTLPAAAVALVSGPQPQVSPSRPKRRLHHHLSPPVITSLSLHHHLLSHHYLFIATYHHITVSSPLATISLSSPQFMNSTHLQPNNHLPPHVFVNTPVFGKQ